MQDRGCTDAVVAVLPSAVGWTDVFSEMSYGLTRCHMSGSKRVCSEPSPSSKVDRKTVTLEDLGRVV